MIGSARLTAALLSAIVRLSPAADGGASAPPGPKATQRGVSFKEAIDWHRERVPMTAEEYSALETSARRRAFTIANIAQLDTAVSVHASIARAIEKGTTFEKWKREVGPALEAEWKGTVDAPATRMELIFRNAVQTAFNAGWYEQATTETAVATRPYWRFDGVADSRQSKICRACNGVILPANDPWFRSHLPPLHHACRSKLTSLTKRQAEALGLTTEERLAEKPLASPGFGVAPDATIGEAERQEAEKQAAYDKRRLLAPVETAQAEQKQTVHDAHEAANAPAAVPAPPNVPAAGPGAPGVPPAAPPGGGGGGGGDERRFIPLGTPLANAFRAVGTLAPEVTETFAEAGKLHGLGDTDLVAVPPFDARMTNARKDRGLLDPSDNELGVSRHDTEKRVTTLHETGHALDSKFIAPGSATWATKHSSKVDDVQQAINDSEAVKTLRELGKKKAVYWYNPVRKKKEAVKVEQKEVNDYLLDDRELFARAYLQYVVTRRNAPELNAEFGALMKRIKARRVYYPEQWEPEDFAPIAEAFDRLFVGLGWMAIQ